MRSMPAATSVRRLPCRYERADVEGRRRSNDEATTKEALYPHLALPVQVPSEYGSFNGSELIAQNL